MSKIASASPLRPVQLSIRIPDELDHAGRAIGEVKNKAYQALTSQMKDTIAYAKNTGYALTLTLRESTRLSVPLQNALATVTSIVRRVL